MSDLEANSSKPEISEKDKLVNFQQQNSSSSPMLPIDELAATTTVAVENIEAKTEIDRICCGYKPDNVCCQTRTCRCLHLCVPLSCTSLVTSVRKMWESPMQMGPRCVASEMLNWAGLIFIMIVGTILVGSLKFLRADPYNWNRWSVGVIAYAMPILFLCLCQVTCYYLACVKSGSCGNRMMDSGICVILLPIIWLAGMVVAPVGYWMAFIVLPGRPVQDAPDYGVAFVSIFMGATWTIFVLAILGVIIFLLYRVFSSCSMACKKSSLSVASVVPAIPEVPSSPEVLEV